MSNILDSRWKLPLHLLYTALVICAMGLSVPRLFMKNQPRTRANTIALGFGAKSLLFIAYQLATEHLQKFRRYKSLKAYWILNSLEIVFWAAVCFLVIQANVARCDGVGCTLSWVVVAIAIILSILAVYTALICWFQYQQERNFKAAAESPYDLSRPSESTRSITKSAVRASNNV